MAGEGRFERGSLLPRALPTSPWKRATVPGRGSPGPGGANSDISLAGVTGQTSKAEPGVTLETLPMRRTLLAVAVAASLLTPLWDLLSPIWGGSENTDAGCGMDPDGRCMPTPQTDAGCGWDPYGSPCGS